MKRRSSQPLKIINSHEMNVEHLIHLHSLTRSLTRSFTIRTHTHTHTVIQNKCDDELFEF